MSLQDILTQRAAIQIQNELGNTPIEDLAERVHQSILQDQQAAKKSKAMQQNLDKIMNLPDTIGGTSENTNAGKLYKSTTIDATTGEMKAIYKSESPSQRATRIKTLNEIKSEQEMKNLRKEFFKDGSELTSNDLIVAGIKPSDAITMSDERGIVNQQRDFLKTQFEAIKSFQAQPTNTGISKQVGGIAIPKRTPAGKPKEIIDIDEQTRIDRASANVQVEKEVKSQEAKDRSDVRKALERSITTTGTAQDAVTRFDKENFDLYGVKPGDYFGLFAKLQPKQTNRYKAAAKGAGREAAATVGIGIIPAARAVRMVELFAESTAEIGNTQEGNASNTAFSNSNIWGNAIANNIEIETKNPDGSYSIQKIRDLVKDPLTNKPLSEIPYPEYLNAVQRAVKYFEKKAEIEYLQRTYDIEPGLLRPETVLEIKSQRRKQRIKELQEKM